MAPQRLLRASVTLLVAMATALVADGARIGPSERQRVEAAGTLGQPSAPEFGSSYEMEYVFSLPYVDAVQSGGLRWAHEAQQRAEGTIVPLAPG